jgi:hypothetical protein
MAFMYGRGPGLGEEAPEGIYPQVLHLGPEPD